MKKLKFRAWVPELKGIYKVDYFRLFPEWINNGDLREVWIDINGDGSAINPVNNPEKVILSQYTNLKDKNGKEIYEGDILRAKKLHMDSPVEFRSDGFINGFYLPVLVIGLSQGTIKELKLHVIGNIYENGELLKQ